MKKITGMMLKTGKWLLVLIFIFSEISFPISVLADKLIDGEEVYQENKELIDNTDNLETIIESDEVSGGLEGDIENVENIELEDVLIIQDSDGAEEVNPEIGENDSSMPGEEVVIFKDQEAILDDILFENEINNSNDVNGDGILNILDPTHSTFINNELEDVIVSDILSNELIIDKESAIIGEKVLVSLYVSGFELAKLYGIEGMLSYDEKVLRLVNIELYESNIIEDDSIISDINVTNNLGYINNNKFAFVLNDGFDMDDIALLTLEFEVIGIGECSITVSDILTSYGDFFELENDNATVSFYAEEAGKGGDVEEDNNTIVEDEEIKEEVMDEAVIEQIVSKPVLLSSDYYIKNLVIDNYEIDFDMYTYDYNITVKNDVTSLDLSVLLNHNNSIYYVEGNDNFKVGDNYVYVVVKAENGSSKTYTIKVTKEKEKVVEKEVELDEEEVSDESKNNVSKNVIIILIILVIIGLIYVIFKDDEEDENINKSNSNIDNKTKKNANKSNNDNKKTKRK